MIVDEILTNKKFYKEQVERSLIGTLKSKKPQTIEEMKNIIEEYKEKQKKALIEKLIKQTDNSEEFSEMCEKLAEACELLGEAIQGAINRLERESEQRKQKEEDEYTSETERFLKVFFSDGPDSKDNGDER